MKIFRLLNSLARQAAVCAVMEAPEGYVCKVSESNRTLDQNAAQWPILEAFSQQLQWPVNGAIVTLESEEWKDILSAAFRQEQPRVAQGLNGGMVLLGQRTSKFGKREFSDWLEFLHATAVEKGVTVYEDIAA